jgi:hypothetical protein
MAHPDVDEGFARFDLVFIVFGEPSAPAPPGEGPLDDPAVWLDGKVSRVWVSSRLTSSSVQLRTQVVDQLAAIAGVRPDQGETGQVRTVEAQRAGEE